MKYGNVFTSALIVDTIILNSKEGCWLCIYLCMYASKLCLVENKMSGAGYTLENGSILSSFKL